jgi:hypothetical protein
MASARQDVRTAAVVAEALGLTATDVENALAYWADFPDEIDDLMVRHRASQDEAVCMGTPPGAR